MDKEARLNTARSLIDKALADTIFFDKRKQARELRVVVRKLASLLAFSWNGRILAPSMCLPEGVIFDFGAEPCPEFLVLTFQSLLVEGPSGQRSVVVFAIETAHEVLETIISGLIHPQLERLKC